MAQYYDYNHKLKVPDLLFTPLNGVELKDGLFKEVFDNNIKFNLEQLDMDRMRYWFDVKMGKPTSAEPYKGHFEDHLKGQTASQYLMCAGNTLRWTENQELRRGMNEILDFMEESQEDDGFLMPIDKFCFAFKEYPHYVRIWLTYGLLAAYLAGEERAAKMLRRWQDWFNSCPDLPVIKYLELAFQGVVASPVVYTTPIGTKEDIEVTEKYYTEDWRLGEFLSFDRECVSNRHQHGHEPHAHGSELEGMEGYLDLYRVNGKPYVFNAVLNCILLYKMDWQHAGGGIVMCERLKGGKNAQRSIYKDPKYTYNELCTSAFWLQLHQRLHRMFPLKEQYVFEMEQSLYNVAIANQEKDTNILNFAWMDMQKSDSKIPNHCCSGVGTRIYASLPEYLFTLNKNTLSCDIYSAAVINWQTENQIVKVTEDTAFPYKGDIKFTFNMEKAEELTVNFRIPHYIENDVEILLNGEKVAEGKKGSYVSLKRAWQDGDTVSFKLDLAFKTHYYYGEDDVDGYTRAAYTYGPLLLAVVGGRNHNNGIVLPFEPEEFISKLHPTDTPLKWTIEGEEEYYVIPYYVLERQSFTCYPLYKGDFKPELPKYYRMCDHRSAQQHPEFHKQ